MQPMLLRMHLWGQLEDSQKTFFTNVPNVITNALLKATWGLTKNVFLQMQPMLLRMHFWRQLEDSQMEALWLRMYFCRQLEDLNTVNWSHVSVQITCVFQCFVTTVALHWTTFVGHKHFQIPLCVKDSRAIFTVFATSLWEFMCVLNFLPPLQDLLHFSQVITLSSCSFCMCILRCFSERALKLHTTQGSMATADLLASLDALIGLAFWVGSSPIQSTYSF